LHDIGGAQGDRVAPRRDISSPRAVDDRNRDSEQRPHRPRAPGSRSEPLRSRDLQRRARRSISGIDAIEGGGVMLRIHVTEAKYELIKMLRLPAYAIPTIAFPVIFYIFFGLLFGKGQTPSGVSVAAY